MTRRRAITLVEVLVAIAIIAVLFALALPAIGWMRRAAVQTQCVMNIRTSAMAIAAYSADYQDSFPMFAERRVFDAFRNGGIRMPYFYQDRYWNIGAASYLTEQRISQEQLCPAGPLAQAVYRKGERDAVFASHAPTFAFSSDYWLGRGLLSSPERWRDGADLLDERTLRAVRFSEVQFASSKGMLIEPRAFHLPGDPYGAAAEISIFGEQRHGLSFSVAFVDQHVQTVPFRDMAEPVEQELDDAAPVLSTKDGALGTDVR